MAGPIPPWSLRSGHARQPLVGRAERGAARRPHPDRLEPAGPPAGQRDDRQHVEGGRAVWRRDHAPWRRRRHTGGYANDGPYIARMRTDGSLDSGFGVGGRARVELVSPPNESAMQSLSGSVVQRVVANSTTGYWSPDDLVLRADGRIVVVGTVHRRADRLAGDGTGHVPQRRVTRRVVRRRRRGTLPAPADLRPPGLHVGLGQQRSGGGNRLRRSPRGRRLDDGSPCERRGPDPHHHHRCARHDLQRRRLGPHRPTRWPSARRRDRGGRHPRRPSFG